MNGNLKLKNSIYFVCFKTYFDSLKGWFSFVPIFVVMKMYVLVIYFNLGDMMSRIAAFVLLIGLAYVSSKSIIKPSVKSEVKSEYTFHVLGDPMQSVLL